MTYILAIDPSLTICGYCVMSHRKKIVKLGQYKVNKDLPFCKKISTIADEIIKLAKENNVTELVLEDIYLAKNVEYLKNWSKLHGAIMYAWNKAQLKETYTMKACQARPKVGISGNAQKIEVQLHISRLFSFIPNSVFYSYCGKIGSYLQLLQREKITKAEYKKRMKFLSREFEKKYQISEHIADAVTLAMAWIEENLTK